MMETVIRKRRHPACGGHVGFRRAGERFDFPMRGMRGDLLEKGAFICGETGRDTREQLLLPVIPPRCARDAERAPVFGCKPGAVVGAHGPIFQPVRFSLGAYELQHVQCLTGLGCRDIRVGRQSVSPERLGVGRPQMDC